MTAIVAAETAGLEGRSPKRRGVPGVALLRSTHGLQRGMLITGLVIITLFVLVAIFAPLLAPYGFNADRTADGEIFGTQQAPSAAHWFGTTVGGQDVLSRVLYGARTALMVILLAVALSLVVGVPLGLVSGYVGGRLDRVLVLVTDALYAFPSLLLAIVVAIMITGGRSTPAGGIAAAAISITVVFVPQYFRVVRNATVSVKHEPYVDAARITGAKPRRIMFKHVLPNVSQTIPVLATLNASEAILTLAGLGFLGFGIEPSAAAEWGYDLNKALSDATNGIWWTGMFPGLAIVLVVTGVTLVGESLNDVLNPLLRTRGGGTTTADEAEVAAGDATDEERS
ncbi:ABC transporter permease [Sanguibacter suaedae]|uniref:ABC transporter permease n=1 Tax=Sanguibacter suaedae TaxID=2795737 RepID=A0A934MEQ7_9MICO|nr:ABC transporter permease [Sanguibacter suaedae]MBI9115919.1 ABC transporter permease [Sanguibacter suaedae]